MTHVSIVLWVHFFTRILFRAIAAVAASRVFINLTLEDYKNKAKELDLNEEINEW